MKHPSELQKLFSLILHITDHYAAEADAEPNWKDGYLVITVQEGGRELYRRTLKLNEGQDAKARLIRHELEQMIAECEVADFGNGGGGVKGEQKPAEYLDGLAEIRVKAMREGGEIEVPALAHKSCPGLAVTMFPFGAFAVTHIKTGCKLCSPSERASTAMLTMSQFALVADLMGEAWADMDQAQASQMIKDANPEEVPFDGYTSTSNKGTRKMTVGEWFQSVRFTFPGEFPWEEKDPFEMAFENFEKLEVAS